MDKKELTTLINQPDKLQERHLIDLLDLEKEFPYFQAIQPLITLASKKYAPQNEKKHLQTAAIYALNRKHLKGILSKPYSKSVSTKEEESNTQAHTSIENRVVSDSTTEPESLKTTDASHLPDSFFEELASDMAALKAEKEHYLETLENLEAKQAKESTKKAKTTKKATPKTTSAKKPSTKAKKTTTTKSTKKKPAAEKTKDSTKKSSTSRTKKATKSTEKKTKRVEYDIIEEITSRKELKIKDAHKKEQLDIINNFIEKDPVLKKRLDTDNETPMQETEDLSASSTNLADDVVSETLAKLMIKQNRKQKAIDIYKKLIWRFPQKKTYFVEIIDELKKES